MAKVEIPLEMAQALMTYLETKPIKEALPFFMALGECIKESKAPKPPKEST